MCLEEVPVFGQRHFGKCHTSTHTGCHRLPQAATGCAVRGCVQAVQPLAYLKYTRACVAVRSFLLTEGGPEGVQGDDNQLI